MTSPLRPAVPALPAAARRSAARVPLLFAAGWILASYAGGSRWRGGLAMAVTGVVLIAAIIALGG